ncbi:MAG: hypothetical protein ACI9KE_002673 [Polyangiales bacterium]|jgi:hypothetical protein
MSAAMNPPNTTSSMTSAQTRSSLRSDGRWGGDATRNPAPGITEAFDDAQALTPQERIDVASTWHMQASTEARVAGQFAVVRDALVSLNADGGLIRLATRAVDDEHRHAALCEDVAGRYLGRVVSPYVVLPEHRPEHPGASDALRHVLYVVGQCCLNETFASAYLSTAQEHATSPVARWALRELLSDEVDHARIGWGFMHDLPPAMNRLLSDWLVPITVCNLREWRSIELPKDDALVAHGIPPHEATQDAITETLHGVVIPGFAHAGLDTRALERWAAAGAVIPAMR